jgi:hypothetical protein
MARRRPVEPSVEEVAELPPLELLRCPATRWNAERWGQGFEEWLRDRHRWRETHVEPLPALFARDRHALRTITGLDQEVVGAELAAPERSP